MKINKITIIIAFLTVSLLLSSCSPDDEYFHLSQEAKDLLLFEVGDTFKLKDHTTNEIITFTVDFKEIDFDRDGGGPSQLISFGPPRDRFFEYGMYRFSDDSDCYSGSVIVEATNTQEFDFKIAFSDACSDAISSFFDIRNESIPTIGIEGITYTNVYSLLDDFHFNELYYSKEQGILRIEDWLDTTLFTIAE